jgi:putative transposase
VALAQPVLSGPLEDNNLIRVPTIIFMEGGLSKTRLHRMKYSQKHKKVKHYHEPGDMHELTFSCFHQMKLLTNDAWRTILSRSIDDACSKIGCTLTAFVYMPDHVHLLIADIQAAEQVSDFLSLVKEPTSTQIHVQLQAANSRLCERLTVQERPGRMVFRYWQEGPGYDRNMQTKAAVEASMQYIHNNPVAAKLSLRNCDWKWSSARFYESDGKIILPEWPRITPLPAEFWL